MISRPDPQPAAAPMLPPRNEVTVSEEVDPALMKAKIGARVADLQAETEAKG